MQPQTQVTSPRHTPLPRIQSLTNFNQHGASSSIVDVQRASPRSPPLQTYACLCLHSGIVVQRMRRFTSAPTTRPRNAQSQLPDLLIFWWISRQPNQVAQRTTYGWTAAGRTTCMLCIDAKPTQCPAMIISRPSSTQVPWTVPKTPGRFVSPCCYNTLANDGRFYPRSAFVPHPGGVVDAAQTKQ